MSTKKKEYIQLDPISHILKRPDMYMGSNRFKEGEDYVADNHFNIRKKTISTCPALTRIFIEVLSNAIDNNERSKKEGVHSSKIKVMVDKDTGETSVWNDGDIVPVEINNEQKCYNHTLIFGRLLSGSNYNDEEERELAGRNGLGSKLCNVCSKFFKVEGADPANGKKLEQIWTNNMRNTEGPKIKSYKLQKGYTKITWIPDFSQFNISGYTDDIVSIYRRHVVDASMITGINVYFNDVLIPCKNLMRYSALYKTVDCDEKVCIKTSNCDVLITPSETYESISFVNGVYTKLGGQHVDAWAEAIFRPIINKINSKSKNSPKVNIADVKQFFRLFVVSRVNRPEFDGQDKNKLESPVIEAKVGKGHISSIMKWSVMERIRDIIRAKEMIVLKKSEKNKKFVKIDGFDPANNAGGKHSSECTLIICEGLSAKTYAVAGIDHGVYGKSGRDWYGIMPLTGKILNVRNAPPTSIAANKVVTNLLQALGARHGVDYTNEVNYKTLNYGKVMVMTDADCDGIHIEGLIINFLHSLFPTLLQRNESFVVSMKTPIARVFNGKKTDKLFYDERRFNEWLSQQPGKVNVKYYKGLGTTKTEDVPDTFGLKMVEYKQDDSFDLNMNKVFHKNNADDRIKWLGEYKPKESTFSLDDTGVITDMKMSDFINTEMIKFSHSDCGRSIPSGIDGLKESQRKILYAVMKRKLKYSGKSVKVAQLSGYTAEHSNYHHGEQNLQETMIGMAQDFVGSNNIPLLYRDGQFGSRLDGGADAASARYIFTKMDALTEYIFREEDEPILKYVNDDGDIVQPETYIPIIPMILVNGCLGIGTGWSSSIPCYNPLELITVVRKWIENEGVDGNRDEKGELTKYTQEEYRPWYRNFKGNILYNGPNKWVTSGVINKAVKKNTVEITELPIGKWTNSFKETLEEMIVSKNIKLLKNYSSPTDVKFTITESENGLLCNTKNMKLTSFLHTSNMVLFNEDNKINKYNHVDDIVDEFCKIRYKYYTKRKNYQIKSIKSKLKILKNKMKFLQNVIDKKINIMNNSESNIIDQIKQSGIESHEDSYEYLLRLQVRTFTLEKVNELKTEMEKTSMLLKQLSERSEKEMWNIELKEFEDKYKKHYKIK